MDRIQAKKAIMRRIYIVWMLRKALNPRFLKAATLGVFFWQLTSYVSLKNVALNMPWQDGGVSAGVQFFGSAITNTELMTQGLMLGIALLGAFLVRDFVKSQSSQGHRAFARI